MTDVELLAALLLLAPVLAAAFVLVARTESAARHAAMVAAAVSGPAGLALCALALIRSDDPLRGDLLALDAAGGILVGVDALIGAVALAASPAYLAGVRSPATRARWRLYYAAMLAFWAALLAVPLVGTLGAAWLLVEATTAASALLVAFAGRPRALEAAWKYLVLTTLGLSVALLGIVALEASAPPGSDLGLLGWHELAAAAPAMDRDAALLAYVLLLAGLATKVGWAPVHNWLPDAHSEAPPPVSALLSAALLPSVLLIAWRTGQVLTPAIGAQAPQRLLIGFGLVSLAVAVPFLWRPLAWKRLLAYSSLEHMGVIALGIGFAHPLALAGVAIHIAGHALAKALGFLAATPLLVDDPRAARRAAGGLARTRPALALPLGVSLAALAALPPAPLFVSEVLIVAGGFAGGSGLAAGVAALLLALGFLGLGQALLELLAGRARSGGAAAPGGLRLGVGLAAGVVVASLALTACAFALPGSAIVEALARGLA